jgi:opacity protein-like surface antigen
MKRSLLVATSVLALAAVSKPLFAAETETPAPMERAAPAAERAPAPAERAAPAPERRARPLQRTTQTRQTSQQSTQQTWTGAQGGGFGGGNAGGGGFADPNCVQNVMGFAQPQSSGLNSIPPQTVACGGINNNAPLKFNKVTGGGYAGYGTLVPGTPFFVGAEAMVSANSVNNAYTLNQTYPGQLLSSVTDSRTATTHIGSSVSVLARFGMLITDKTLIYFSGGTATAKVSGTFTQTAMATSYAPMASATVVGSSTVSQTTTGYVLGGGVEIAYLPGVKIRLQYLHAQFPDVTFTTPLIATCTSPTCISGAATNSITPSFNQVTVGVGLGF